VPPQRVSFSIVDNRGKPLGLVPPLSRGNLGSHERILRDKGICTPPPKLQIYFASNCVSVFDYFSIFKLCSDMTDKRRPEAKQARTRSIGDRSFDCVAI